MLVPLTYIAVVIHQCCIRMFSSLLPFDVITSNGPQATNWPGHRMLTLSAEMLFNVLWCELLWQFWELYGTAATFHALGGQLYSVAFDRSFSEIFDCWMLQLITKNPLFQRAVLYLKSYSSISWIWLKLCTTSQTFLPTLRFSVFTCFGHCVFVVRLCQCHFLQVTLFSGTFDNKLLISLWKSLIQILSQFVQTHWFI